MKNLKDYDVLRLIEHNQICHVSSDNIRGCSLVNWMKYHPYISKEQLYHWVRDIIRQLIQIHKCSGNPCYQYVNPYSIIVTETGKVCFLDISADSNWEIVRRMQGRSVREYFLPEKQNCYYISDKESDIYGLGKTIQYLLAFVEILPGLTRWEEKRFQKIILKCTQRKVTDMQKLLMEIR